VVIDFGRDRSGGQPETRCSASSSAGRRARTRLKGQVLRLEDESFIEQPLAQGIEVHGRIGSAASRRKFREAGK
jgi:hypothetical protein